MVVELGSFVKLACEYDTYIAYVIERVSVLLVVTTKS